MSAPAAATTTAARRTFDLNLGDARMLLDLAKLLENQRSTRMRREKRERLGAALSIPKAKWNQLECLENERVFVTFLPGYASLRSELTEESLRPLLRQAIVAACAAIETFVAERAMEIYPHVVRYGPIPPKLAGLQMDVGDWFRIEGTYEKRGWGIRSVVATKFRRTSSTHPGTIGDIFQAVGVDKVVAGIDVARSVPRGTTSRQLDELRERRNRIVHEADRAGRGRAMLSVPETEVILADVAAIVDAMDAITNPSQVKLRLELASKARRALRKGAHPADGHT